MARHFKDSPTSPIRDLNLPVEVTARTNEIAENLKLNNPLTSPEPLGKKPRLEVNKVDINEVTRVVDEGILSDDD